ncbi:MULTISPECIES: hypothetical protein [Bradyrhizobium]|uniref:hypothetical protein n=1 Tax=Bradyrhizobium elkanii TaxID=29448 RepID=UPI0027151133|nr:hypothetical protein [Bradyrhizobium elkanii]WLA52044.1 hypothetical protein QIH80_19180 [Bradyrhizobium elkanii]WLB77628.1 hypothetical protein QIH83_24990 [Bradyrhizobium elkanii]
MIEAQRENSLWLPDDDGVAREAFFHGFTSCWEWSTSILEEAGVTRTLREPPPPAALAHLVKPDPKGRSPFSYPLMTLDECRAADFSAFETFDNYCYAMFTYWQLLGQISGRDVIDLSVLSPRFMEAVATKDDIFLVEGIYRVRFREDRFERKVMTRWREMDLRVFRRQDAA